MKQPSDLIAEATDRINQATPGSIAEQVAQAYRRGVLDGLAAAGFSPQSLGRLLMAEDSRQMDLGHNRPMCGGAWLDKDARRLTGRETRLAEPCPIDGCILERRHTGRCRPRED